jgi:16S rRNA (guanine966-N2)-methyltransferase
VKKIKVTGGSLRSRSIEILEHTEARYTPSKVREAIFNIMGDVDGKRVLDLFAGSGSFSIEALSRGAAMATLVERNPEMSALIGRNLESLSLAGCAEVLTMEVRRALPFLYKKGAKYDIIFMDPPYDKGYVSETTSLLRDNEVYGPDALFVIEHSKREQCAGPEPAGGEDAFTRRYGDTCLTIYEPHRGITKRSP